MNFGGDNHDDIGETTKQFYSKIRAIQNGVDEDTHGWNMKIHND
jgi:hypothetical protein